MFKVTKETDLILDRIEELRGLHMERFQHVCEQMDGLRHDERARSSWKEAKGYSEGVIDALNAIEARIERVYTI